MKWNIDYTPPESPVKISYKDKLLLMGSCFTESIGEKLKTSKFNCVVNPNGVLFNPHSIAAAIRYYLKDLIVCEPDYNNGLYFSFDYHGSFSTINKIEFAKKINSAQDEARRQLSDAGFLIISFGTAFVYRHLTSGQIVANCHKLPNDQFKKELSGAETIIKDYRSLLSEIYEFNPDLKIIFTVSPVRYLKDGLAENNLSKAILLQSVHTLVKENKNCFYFPAYELVIDDLRDYRFYKEDLSHPNDIAIDYVWSRFRETYFNTTTRAINERVSKIVKSAAHRPLHPGTTDYNQFKNNQLKACEEIENEFPFISMGKEKQYFNSL